MWPGYEKRIQLLQEGKTLVMSHGVYGKYRLFAEPIDELAKKLDDVRIKDEKTKAIHYDPNCVRVKAEAFVLWGHGEWSVELVKPQMRLVEVNDPGEYEKL